MTSVIMIAPLNAANFESGNAGDGQVLTADGAGNAAWETPAGGAGASFAWDGAEIVATLEGDPAYNLNVTVQLKIGAENYTGMASFDVVSKETGSEFLIELLGTLTDLDGSRLSGFGPILSVFNIDGTTSMTLQRTNGETGIGRVYISLPSGGWAQSNLFEGWILGD